MRQSCRSAVRMVAAVIAVLAPVAGAPVLAQQDVNLDKPGGLGLRTNGRVVGKISLDGQGVDTTSTVFTPFLNNADGLDPFSVTNDFDPDQPARATFQWQQRGLSITQENEILDGSAFFDSDDFFYDAGVLEIRTTVVNDSAFWRPLRYHMRQGVSYFDRSESSPKKFENSSYDSDAQGILHFTESLQNGEEWLIVQSNSANRPAVERRFEVGDAIWNKVDTFDGLENRDSPNRDGQAALGLDFGGIAPGEDITIYDRILVARRPGDNFSAIKDEGVPADFDFSDVTVEDFDVTITPDTINWVGSNDGSWADTAQWDLARTPRPGDSVIIDQVSDPIVTIGSGNDVGEVDNLTVGNTLRLAENSRLDVRNQAEIFGGIEIADGSTLGGDGEIRVKGGGTLDLDGAVTLGKAAQGAVLFVESNGTVTKTGAGLLTLSAPNFGMRIENQGRLVFEGGGLTGRGTLRNSGDGEVVFATPDTMTVGADNPVENAGGTIRWTSGDIELGAPNRRDRAFFTDGLFSIEGAGRISDLSSPNADGGWFIDNRDRIVKAENSGTTTFDIYVDNAPGSTIEIGASEQSGDEGRSRAVFTRGGVSRGTISFRRSDGVFQGDGTVFTFGEASGSARDAALELIVAADSLMEARDGARVVISETADDVINGRIAAVNGGKIEFRRDAGLPETERDVEAGGGTRVENGALLLQNVDEFSTPTFEQSGAAALTDLGSARIFRAPERFHLTGGTFRAGDVDITTADFRLSDNDTTLATDGTVTVNDDDALLIGGTIGGSGTVIIADGSTAIKRAGQAGEPFADDQTLDIAAAAELRVDGDYLVSDGDLGGPGALTISQNGRLALSGEIIGFRNGLQLTNNGQVTVANGLNVRFRDFDDATPNGQLTNNGMLVLNSTLDGDGNDDPIEFIDQSAQGGEADQWRVVNSGTLRKTGEGRAALNVALDSATGSLIDVQAGALNLGREGTHNGTLNLEDDTIVTLNGIYNFGNEASLTGTGEYRLVAPGTQVTWETGVDTTAFDGTLRAGNGTALEIKATQTSVDTMFVGGADGLQTTLTFDGADSFTSRTFEQKGDAITTLNGTSFNVAQRVAINGGVFDAGTGPDAVSFTTQEFDFRGESFIGAGTVTATGRASEIDRGLFTGGGTVAIADGGSLFVDGDANSPITLDSGFSIDLYGSANIRSGRIDGPGTINVLSASGDQAMGIFTAPENNPATNVVTFGGGLQIVNQGKIAWGNSDIALADAGLIDNRAGSVFRINAATGQAFEIADNSRDALGNSGWRINNAGQINKTSEGLATIFAPVDNRDGSVVEVRDGTLVLSGGGIQRGDYEVRDGAALRFGGDESYTIENTATLNVDTGGSLGASSGGIVTIAGGLDLSAASAFDGDLFVGDGATLTVDPADVDIGSATVQNGTLQMASASAATFFVDDFRQSGANAETRTNGRDFEAADLFQITGGSFFAGADDVDTARFVLDGDTDDATLDIAGVLRVTGADSRLDDGTLTGGGSVLIADGATAEKRAASGILTIDDGFALTVFGTYDAAGGTIAGPGDLTIGTDVQGNRGRFGITDDLSLDEGLYLSLDGGTLAWRGGTLTLEDISPGVRDGRIDIATGGVFEVGQGAQLVDNSFEEDTGGGSEWSATNSGVFRKTGPDTMDLPLPLDTTAQGEVEVLGGTLNFVAGGRQAGLYDVRSGTNLRFSETSYRIEDTADLDVEAGGSFGAGRNADVTIESGVDIAGFAGNLFVGDGSVLRTNPATMTVGSTTVANGTLRTEGTSSLISPVFSQSGGNAATFLLGASLAAGDEFALTGGVFFADSDTATGAVNFDTARLVLRDARLDNAGRVTATGPNSRIDSGRLSGGGEVEIASGAAATKASGSGALVIDAGNLLDIQGSYTVNGGDLAGPGDLDVGTGGTLTFGGNSRLDNGLQLTNAGFVQWTGGDLDLVNTGGGAQNGLIDNKTGAVFEITGGSDLRDIAGDGADWSIDNAGILRKTGGGTTDLFVALSQANSGEVEVVAGRLDLHGAAGATNGTFDVQNQGVLRLSDGTYTLDSNIAMIVAQGGSLGAGTDAQVTIASDADFSQFAGDLAVESNSTLNIEAPVASVGGTTVANGTLVFTGSGSQSYISPVFTQSGDSALTQLNGTGFIPSDRFALQGGVFEAGSVAFTTAQAVIDGGTLDTTATLTATGTQSELESGTLRGQNGRLHLTAGSQASKSGGGALAIESGFTLENDGIYRITGGTLAGPGDVQNDAGGRLYLAGDIGLARGLHIANDGTIAWESGNIGLAAIADDGTRHGLIDNRNLFEIAGSGQLNDNSVDQSGNSDWEIRNTGTFRKAAPGRTDIFAFLNNQAPGTVEVTDGTLALRGGGTQEGAFMVSAPGTLAFADRAFSLTGSGAVISGDGGFKVESGGDVSITDTADLTGFSGDVFVTGTDAALTIAQNDPVSVATTTVERGGALTLNTAGYETQTFSIDDSESPASPVAAEAIINDADFQAPGVFSITSGTVDATGAGSQLDFATQSFTLNERFVKVGDILETRCRTVNGETRCTTVDVGDRIEQRAAKLAFEGTIEVTGSGHLIDSGAVEGGGTLRIAPGAVAVKASTDKNQGFDQRIEDSGDGNRRPPLERLRLADNTTIEIAGIYDVRSGLITGNGNLDIASAGTLIFAPETVESGSRKVRLGGGLQIVNEGTIDWQNADIELQASNANPDSVIDNRGTFTVSGDTMSGAAGDWSILNTGTVAKTGGGTTTIGIALETTETAANGGLLRVSNGTLALTAGGDQAGRVHLRNDTALSLSGGTYDLASTADLDIASGARLSLTNADMTIDANSDVTGVDGSVTVGNGATLTVNPATLAIGQETRVSGGTLDFRGADLSTTDFVQTDGLTDLNSVSGDITAFAADGSFSLAGGRFERGDGDLSFTDFSITGGTLQMQGLLSLTDTAALDGGTFEGGREIRIEAGATATKSQNLTLTIPRGFTVNNYGTFTLHQGTVAGAATINNKSADTLIFDPENTLTLDRGLVVNNESGNQMTFLSGTLNLQDSEPEAVREGRINNLGGAFATADIASGTSGIYDRSADAVWLFDNAGSFEKKGGGRYEVDVAFTNDGDATVTGGTLSFGAGSAMNGSVLAKTGTTIEYRNAGHSFAADSSLEVESGATLSLVDGAVLDLTSVETVLLNGSIFNRDSTLLVDGVDVPAENFTQRGDQALTDLNDRQFTVSGRFELDGGLFEGTAVTFTNSDFNFLSGTMDVAGPITLDGDGVLESGTLLTDAGNTGFVFTADASVTKRTSGIFALGGNTGIQNAGAFEVIGGTLAQSDEAIENRDGGTLTVRNAAVGGAGDLINRTGGMMTLVAGARMIGPGELINETDADLAITGTTTFDQDRDLDNAGRIAWTGGDIVLADYTETFGDGDGLIHNRSGATIAIDGGGSIRQDRVPPGNWAFDNDGEIVKEAGGLTEFDIAFDGNSGSLKITDQAATVRFTRAVINDRAIFDIQAGTLDFAGSAEDQTLTFGVGTNLQVAGGATLAAGNAADLTLSTGGTLATAGSLSVRDDAAITVDHARTIGGDVTSADDGTVTFQGDATVNGAVTASGSSVQRFDGAATIGGDVAASGTARLSIAEAADIGGDVTLGTGQTDAAELNVGGAAKIDGSLALDGSGRAEFAGNGDIGGSVDATGSSIVTVAGTGSVTGNTTLSESASLSIADTASFGADVTVRNNAALSLQAANPSVAGQVTLGGGTITVDRNAATVLTVGDYRQTGGSANLQSADLAVENNFFLSGGAFNIGNRELEVGNRTEIRGSSVDLNNQNSFESADFALTGGRFAIDGDLVLDGSAQLDSGTIGAGTRVAIENDATVTKTAGGTLNLETPPADAMAGGPPRIDNAGSFTVTGGAISGRGRIRNEHNALMAFDGNGTKTLDLGVQIENEGALTFEDGRLALDGSDTVVRNLAGGTITLNGDLIEDVSTVPPVEAPRIVNAGTLRKTSGNITTIDTALNSGGDAEVRAGTLRLSGVSALQGRIDVANGAGLEFRDADHVVGGAASLRVARGGRLDVLDSNANDTSPTTLTIEGGAIVDIDGTAFVGNNASLVAGPERVDAAHFELAQGGSLDLQGGTLNVTEDYVNKNSGAANGFDRHAGVSNVAGGIVAEGLANDAMLVDGPGVTRREADGALFIELGDVNVGDDPVEALFSVMNQAAGGPLLRGGINIDQFGADLDERFSINGQEDGGLAFDAPLGAGDAEDFTLRFDPVFDTGGEFLQKFTIVNNFDNVDDVVVNVATEVFDVADAQLSANAIDFGIVHATPEEFAALEAGIDVTNPSNDSELRIQSFGGSNTGPFITDFDFNDIPPGATAENALSARIDGVLTPGLYQNLAFADVRSVNPNGDLNGVSDLPVDLKIQVNNFAAPEFAFDSGDAEFFESEEEENTWVLDFGLWDQFTTPDIAASVQFLNALPFADTLAGGFDLINVPEDSPFAFDTDFDDMVMLESLESLKELEVIFDTFEAGIFEARIDFTGFGFNSSGYSEEDAFNVSTGRDDAPRFATLLIRGEIAAVDDPEDPQVPAPPALWLLLIGMAGVYHSSRLAAKPGL